MRTALFKVLAAAVTAACLATAGCTANIGDVNLDIDDAKVQFDTDVDVDNVQQGDTFKIHIDAENVFLVDPDQDPPKEHRDDAGHFQIYLDNFDSDPLVVTADVDVQITIPEDTEPGDHSLKCRVHKHDGTPTEAVFEIKITVKAKAGTG